MRRRDWPEYSRGSASSNSAGASQGALSDGRMSEMFAYTFKLSYSVWRIIYQM